MTLEAPISCNNCLALYPTEKLTCSSKICPKEHSFCDRCIEKIFQKAVLDAIICPTCGNEAKFRSPICPLSLSDESTAVKANQEALSQLQGPSCDPKCSSMMSNNLTPFQSLIEERACSIIAEGVKIQFSDWGLNNVQLNALRLFNKKLYDQVIDLFTKQVEVFLWEPPAALLNKLRYSEKATLTGTQVIRLLLLLNSQEFLWVDAKLIYFFSNHKLNDAKINHDNFDPQTYFANLFDLCEIKRNREPTTLYSLAFCYEFGIGVEVDIEKAAKLYSEIYSIEEANLSLKIKHVLIKGINKNWGSKEQERLRKFRRARPENPLLNFMMADIEKVKSLAEEDETAIRESSSSSIEIARDQFIDCITASCSATSSEGSKNSWISLIRESSLKLSPEEEKGEKLLRSGIASQFAESGLSSQELEIIYNKNKELYFQIIELIYGHIKGFLWECPEDLVNEVQSESVLSNEQCLLLVLLLAKQRVMQDDAPIANSVRQFMRNHSINLSADGFNSQYYYKYLYEINKLCQYKVPEFCYRLAFCCEYGIGVETNMKAACKLYERAAKSKLPCAITKLTLLSCSSKKSPRKSPRSKIASLKSAPKDVGNPIVQYMLGQLLLNSKMEDERMAAIQMLISSAQKGVVGAQRLCESCLSSRNPE